MRDDLRGVDVAAQDALEERPHVLLHVALTAAHGEPFPEHRAERELVHEPGVDADHRQPSPLAARLDGLAQHVRAVHLEPHRLLHPVGHGID